MRVSGYQPEDPDGIFDTENPPDQDGWIKIIDEKTLPVPPCIGYWNDGRQTVLDSQNDCEYAVNLIDGKTITHWQPLPTPPKEG